MMKSKKHTESKHSSGIQTNIQPQMSNKKFMLNKCLRILEKAMQYCQIHKREQGMTKELILKR